MAIRFVFPTPPVGTEGVFELQTPFTTLPNERFKCIANRRISDYISKNEDPWKDIYKAHGLTESEYEDDAKDDLEITTLVNGGGFTVEVPVRFILSYPIKDGVAYRRLGYYITLPPTPVSKDLTFYTNALKELTKSKLGVDCEITEQEASYTAAIPPNAHLIEDAKRKIVIGSNVTDYARIKVLENALAEAQGKIQQLEAFIIATNSGP